MTTQANTTIAQIAQLPQLPMENLWALWDDLFDRRPGHHQRTYLESRIAYRLQERAFGGLSWSLLEAFKTAAPQCGYLQGY